MQCVNCGFENIPGQSTCIRCQSQLNLADVSVRPPRASARARRMALRLRRLCPPGWFERVWRRWPAFRTLWRLSVPGLWLLHDGRKRWAWYLFGGWVTFLLVSVFLAGSAVTDWTLLGAIGLHVVSITLWMAPGMSADSLQRRLLMGLLLFVGLRFAVYGPVSNLIGRAVKPLQLAEVREGALIRSGDVLLYAGDWFRSEPLERGDLVVYRIEAQSGRGFYIHDGYGVDRVVGLPGDDVLLLKGALTVNGAEVTARPLGEIVTLPDFELHVPEGKVAILPSLFTLTIPRNAEYEPFMASLASVDQKNVGRVWLRYRPWTRFGNLDGG